MSTLHVIAYSTVRPALTPDWDSSIAPAERRKTPRIWQMASVAVRQLLGTAERKPRSIVTATALGALDETRAFLDALFRTGLGSPRNFIASVHNSMAGKIALDFGISGPNLTVCDGQNSLASALAAANLLRDGDFPVLVMAIDESIALLKHLNPHLSADCRRYLDADWPEGAVALLCERPEERDCLSSRDGPSSSVDMGVLTFCGPVPLSSGSPQETCNALAQTRCASGCRMLDLQESSSSFMQPAFSVASLLAERVTQPVVVPSYSPTARAVALVQVCG